MLIENIYCNWSGGSAMGSLGAGVAVSNIVYKNVYSVNCNQMYMIKSNGGSGTVKNIVLENFIGHGNAYSLDFNSYWSSMTPVAGNGISYSGITFSVGPQLFFMWILVLTLYRIGQAQQRMAFNVRPYRSYAQAERHVQASLLRTSTYGPTAAPQSSKSVKMPLAMGIA